MFKNQQENNFEVFNIGTGKGSSVIEVIKAFEDVSKQKLNYKIVERRKGDVISAYADTTKVNNTLGWKPQYSLNDAILDAWKWEQKIRTK